MAKSTAERACPFHDLEARQPLSFNGDGVSVAFCRVTLGQARVALSERCRLFLSSDGGVARRGFDWLDVIGRGRCVDVMVFLTCVCAVAVGVAAGAAATEDDSGKPVEGVLSLSGTGALIDGC